MSASNIFKLTLQCSENASLPAHFSGSREHLFRYDVSQQFHMPHEHNRKILHSLPAFIEFLEVQYWRGFPQPTLSTTKKPKLSNFFCAPPEACPSEVHHGTEAAMPGPCSGFALYMPVYNGSAPCTIYVVKTLAMHAACFAMQRAHLYIVDRR